MTPPDTADIDGLDAELASFRDLMRVMRLEHDALRRADADAVADLYCRKLQKLAALGTLSKQRVERMRRAQVPDNTAGIEAWLGLHPKAAHAIECFAQLLSLAQDAFALNQSSRRLADQQYRHFERAGTALRRAAGRDGVYGADGRSQGIGAPRTLATI